MYPIVRVYNIHSEGECPTLHGRPVQIHLMMPNYNIIHFVHFYVLLFNKTDTLGSL